MTSETVKPPWTQVQWYTQPKLTLENYGATAVEGEWQENRQDEIEALKESIQPQDKTELWDLAKRITNPQELISTFSSRLKLPPSTCCLHPLSRSFFKMIEMLHHLQFFERHKNPKFRSLHVCEGPGGFIEAFQYLADNKKRIIGDSYAMTLKSTHTMIPGWRRATQFLQKNTNIHLLQGPTKTGDIQEPINQQACQQAVGSTGAQLVTADGGFDFSDDFTAQEKNILKLLVNSAIITLECVSIEGDIVIKLFDCNSPTTRDLITILASCFSSQTLQKPVTSRPCNSEWQFLGKSAIRERKAAIQRLKEIRDGLAKEEPNVQTRFLQINPIDDFLIGLQEKRAEKQKDSLKKVLSFCNQAHTVNHEQLWEENRKATIRWCQDFRMPTQYKLF